eukprot:m.112073 g.112073  ORF g.112073 m.112073 type:complete len:501 (-) comp14080_c1_seq4:203-1705(-)
MMKGTVFLCLLVQLVSTQYINYYEGQGVGSRALRGVLHDSASCNYTNNIDYDTTVGSSTHANSEDECCQACTASPTCLVGVYQDSSKTCFLKGGIVKAKTKNGVVSCRARQDPKPAAPYDCSKPDKNTNMSCAERIGATIWNPCYFLNSSLPVLLDGAQSLAKSGSKTIKVAVFSPKGNYPYNSPLWPQDGFQTLLDMTKHPYYQALWAMPEFDHYVLIAYSTVGGTSGGDISYYRFGINATQEAEETKQFYESAKYLLDNYGHMGKTFVFENWEGDWASRGHFDPKTPATPLALYSMRKWLAARQAGVTMARSQYKEEHGIVESSQTMKPNVFFSAELNLVQQSRLHGDPNMINQVIPFVKLDMVSYSSYDTQQNPENFLAALNFIQSSHNRTEASPPGPAAIFVAEYGMGENQAPNSTIVFTVENVINEALSWGARYTLYWEIYDNECTGGPGCQAGRCHNASEPVTDPHNLHGFWLFRPDGSEAWPFKYLQSKINEE